MKKSVFAVLGALSLCLAAAQSGPATVNVGILFDYTGALAEFGPGMERGARLAADQLNEAAQAVFGGPLINLVVEDAATSAAVGVDRARKLVETDNVVAIVGALGSGVTVAVAESVTIPGQVSLISPASTSPLLTIMEDNDFLFRTVSSDATQGIVGGQLARGEFFPDNMHETASIMYLNNPYGQGLAEAFRAAFEARGGRVLAMVAHPDEPQPTYAAELEALLANGPDVILAASYPGQATVYMAEARDLFDFTSWQFTDGTQSDLIVDAVGAEVVEGLYGTAPGADPEWAGAQLFRDLFESAHGELPNLPFIDTTYDAVSVIGLAVAQAYVDGVEPTSTNVRDRLRTVAAGEGEAATVGEFEAALRTLQAGGSINYTGAAGEVDFDEAGDVITPVEVWQYQSSAITPVEIRKADEIPAN
jgi:ABC-type branched-subunit amino acid transport system substrate-binding protein